MWTEIDEDDELIEKDDYIPEEYSDLDSILEDDEIFPKKRTRRKKTETIATDEYVNKNEMWTELYNYYMSHGDGYDWKEQRLLDKTVFPPISNRLTTIIYDISTKMGHRGNFCGYSWLDEMKGDAVLKMIKAVRDCSFKCFTTAKIVNINKAKGTILYYDKKNKLQEKIVEPDDVFFEENGDHMITFKANPFGYFSRITSHCYLNRIRKENELEEAKRTYQRETWERLYSNENFRNVRRPKFIESDENDGILEE